MQTDFSKGKIDGQESNQPLPWNLESLLRPPRMFPTTDVVAESLRSFYFEGEPYRGEPTRVFAFYGTPAHSAGEKLPAMVLVHGGGGSALSEWVNLWVSRGYAAIAFDHNGSIPVGSHFHWKKNPQGGPPLQALEQIDWPLKDQWVYHAVADTILACSLLESFPEIDRNRIGLTGVSWGAVISSIVAGIDARFKFVAPVYGCGFISDEEKDGSCFVGASGGDPEKLRRWRELWDPANYLPRIGVPILWTTGTNDFAFTLGALRSSYRSVSAPSSLSIHLRMPHGHDGPGERPEEIHAFANHFLRGGAPLLQIRSAGHDNGLAWVDYDSEFPLKRAELLFTLHKGRWQDRHWDSLEVAVNPSSQRVSALLPDGVTGFFFNLIDDCNLVVSSELLE